jgi:transcriptional regulator with XRE-family HTH domain
VSEYVRETRRAEARGVNVLPLRVRRARQDAGLTLAQLADGRVSRTAIHLIETGRSRPSRETLEHIASRTGKPVSYFLGTSSESAEPTPSDIARQTEELMRQVTWKLAHLLRHEDLTGPERIALEGVLMGVRQGIRLIRSIHGDDAQDRDRSPSAAPAADPPAPPRLLK